MLALAAAGGPVNCYRVTIGFPGAGLIHKFDVDASDIAVAAKRALDVFKGRDDANVQVKLIGRNVVRPRVEKQSYGRARAAT